MKSTFNVHHNNNQYHNFAMTKCYSSFKFSHNYQSDNNPHGPVEDRQTPEVGEGGSKVGPLLRVWGSPAHVVDVLLCPHRPLAGLHMVRHRQLRTLPTAGWLLDANFLSFFFYFLVFNAKILNNKKWICNRLMACLQSIRYRSIKDSCFNTFNLFIYLKFPSI